MVVLAQLVAHRIVVPSVVGSSPTFHPKAEYQQTTTKLYKSLSFPETQQFLYLSRWVYLCLLCEAKRWLSGNFHQKK